MSWDRRTSLVATLCALLMGAGCDGTGPTGQAPGSSPVRPCVTETAPPSRTPPEELVRRITDPAGDFVLDHPLFAEVYDVVFEDNRSIPPALDLIEAEVISEGPIHTIRLHTEGDVREELGNEEQRINYGLYVDSDGNGVSEYVVTTTAGADRAVIVTPEFEVIAEAVEVEYEGNVVTLHVPAEVVGERFHWIAFSGYSPRRDAFHPTAMPDVFVVPDVDVVSSLPSMGGLITFYSGPGVCQVIDKLAVAGCPSSPPFIPIPGTSQQGKLFYRKQCGSTIYEFWCRGCCFGSRVYGGATTGWVGRCPFVCGWNSIAAWDTNSDGTLDKTYHTVRDADCSDQPNPKKHDDSYDNDNKIDSMEHTYLYASDQLTSCNKERDEITQSLLANRCCPIRKPLANHMDVPGSIDGSAPNYNCPVSAP